MCTSHTPIMFINFWNLDFPSDMVKMCTTWFSVSICFTFVSPNNIYFPNEVVLHFYVL